MGSPYTNIYAIDPERFDAFDRGLERIKGSLAIDAWRSLMDEFSTSPADLVEEMVEDGSVAEGVEPDWFNESLVSTLKAAIIYNCPYIRTEPGLIQDLWLFLGTLQLTRVLHSLCLTPEERLQACLYRLLFLDPVMLDAALANCVAPMPAARIDRKRRWCRHIATSARKSPDGPDPIDRNAASTVAFAYRYPLCLLDSVANEAILSPDQVGQLAPAAAPAGLLERFADALHAMGRRERDDIMDLVRLLQGLEPPFPYLYSIAYGT